MTQESTVRGAGDGQAQDWNSVWGIVVCLMLVVTVIVWLRFDLIGGVVALWEFFQLGDAEGTIVDMSGVVAVELVVFAAVIGLTDLSERNIPHAYRTFGRMFVYTLVCILLSVVTWWLASNHYTGWALLAIWVCAIGHPILGVKSIADT